MFTSMQEHSKVGKKSEINKQFIVKSWLSIEVIDLSDIFLAVHELFVAQLRTSQFTHHLYKGKIKLYKFYTLPI
jgi:hypothetical protein